MGLPQIASDCRRTHSRATEEELRLSLLVWQEEDMLVVDLEVIYALRLQLMRPPLQADDEPALLGPSIARLKLKCQINAVIGPSGGRQGNPTIILELAGP
jgi:hypothetical protein